VAEPADGRAADETDDGLVGPQRAATTSSGFRVVKSQAVDREIDDVTTVPR
jgi:hypothetical protein